MGLMKLVERMDKVGTRSNGGKGKNSPWKVLQIIALSALLFPTNLQASYLLAQKPSNYSHMSSGLTFRGPLYVLSRPFTGTELVKHSDYLSSAEKEIETQM